MRTYRRVSRTLCLLIVYIVLSLFYFGTRPNIETHIFGLGTDPFSFIWVLEWWPWAIVHHLNPFVSKLIWYPQGLNLAWSTAVPTLAFLGLPITAIGNAVATFNILTLLAPALGAWCAYLLARRLTGDTFASAIGGYIYGFCAYEGGHLLGHLNLDITVVPPLLLLLSIERVTGERGPVSYILLLAVALIAQFGISTEIFATSCVFGALTWAVFTPFLPQPLRKRMLLLPLDIAVAVIIVLAVVSPYLVYIIKGSKGLPAVINPPEAYSADALNFLIPTPMTRIGRSVFTSISSHFPGNEAEQGAYLGLPLAIILTAFFARNRRGIYAAPLLIVLLCMIVFSLGPALWLNGVQTHIPLPWAWAAHVPFLRSALPGRFTLYVSLAAAVVAALWLAEWQTLRAKLARLAMGALACAFLVPNSAAYSWNPIPFVPFFNPRSIEANLGTGKNVLILPFGFSGPGMIWQWQAGFRFTQSGGYFGMTPPSETAWPIVNLLPWGNPGPNFRHDLQSYCLSHHVDAVLAGPGTAQPLLDALDRLGWPERRTGGVAVFTVPAKD